MGLRLYLFSLFASFLISLGLALIILVNVNPFNAPIWMLSLFYVCLFIIIASILSLSIFYIKVRMSNREVIYSHLLPSLRQSAIVAFGIVVLLFLEHLKVLNWWIVSLFIASLIMIELFFRSSK